MRNPSFMINCTINSLKLRQNIQFFCLICNERMGICSVSGVRGIPVESHKQKWENSVGESLFFKIIPIVSFSAWRYIKIYIKKEEWK